MIQTLIAQVTKEETKTYINTTIAAKLKREPQTTQSEVEHILDYLESKDAPKRFLKMSYDEAKKQSEAWIQKMNKKAGEVVETKQDTKVILKERNGGGMRFVELIGEAAFKREGALMSHCVASYYGKSGTKVYSLRDANNNPHCTIEVQGESQVQQIKGKGNGSIHPKYISYVLRILKYFKLPVRDTELSNLGYDLLEGAYLRLFDSVYQDYKFITFNNKKYLYRYQDLRVKQVVSK
jgi:hypothetical protein